VSTRIVQNWSSRMNSVLRADEVDGSLPRRVPERKLVEDVGVMEGEVGDDEPCLRDVLDQPAPLDSRRSRQRDDSRIAAVVVTLPNGRTKGRERRDVHDRALRQLAIDRAAAWRHTNVASTFTAKASATPHSSSPRLRRRVDPCVVEQDVDCTVLRIELVDAPGRLSARAPLNAEHRSGEGQPLPHRRAAVPRQPRAHEV